MSDIYFQEPPTSGKVVLLTSNGELDIELWCDETPRACRNFIQLCLEEYYDNTIFHRMVPGFMIQGGDPTGTGRGGDSIFGKPFLDEFHQRLKFSHRGMVAMANSGPNDNRSQFFITFDAASHLDKKHTIFGKVVGDTVYNLMAMQNLDIDKNDRPANPPKILSTKVIINPFDDIFVRHNTRKQKEEEERQKKLKEETKKKPAAKKAKNVNLLSFADDEDAQDIVQDAAPAQETTKIVSSHDVLKDPKLSSQPVISQAELERRAREKEEAEKKKEELRSKVAGAKEKAPKDEPQKDLSFDEQMRKNMKAKMRVISKDNPAMNVNIPQNEENAELMNFSVKINPETGKREYHWEGQKESESSGSSSSSDESSEDESYANENDKKIRQKQKEEYNNLRVEMLQFKKEKLGTNNLEVAEKNRQEKKLLSNLELRKAKYLQDKKTKRHEDDVEDRLKAFQKKINASQGNESNWMSNKLKFHIDSARAYSHFENKGKAGGFVRDDREDANEIRRTTEDEQGRLRVDVLGIDDIIKMTE